MKNQAATGLTIRIIRRSSEIGATIAAVPHTQQNITTLR